VVWSVLWKTAFCFSYALLNIEVLIWCQSSCLLHDFCSCGSSPFPFIFLPNQMYICDSLNVHISQFFMHCLPSTSVQCSCEWLLFHLWFYFLGLFFPFCLLMCFHVSCLYDVYTYHLNSILLFYDLFFTLYLYAIKFLCYSSLMQFGDQCQKMQISR